MPLWWPILSKNNKKIVQKQQHRVQPASCHITNPLLPAQKLQAGLSISSFMSFLICFNIKYNLWHAYQNHQWLLCHHEGLHFFADTLNWRIFSTSENSLFLLQKVLGFRSPSFSLCLSWRFLPSLFSTYPPATAAVFWGLFAFCNNYCRASVLPSLWFCRESFLCLVIYLPSHLKSWWVKDVE